MKVDRLVSMIMILLDKERIGAQELAVFGIPPYLPRARAALRPSFVRSEITSRSNCAMADINVKSSFPVEVLVSMNSFKLTK